MSDFQLLKPDMTAEAHGVQAAVYAAKDAHPFAKCPGWARFARCVVLTAGYSPSSDHGPLLEAEWVDAKGTSHRIGPAPAGDGTLSHWTYPASNGFYTSCEKPFGHGPAAGHRLCYDIFWHDEGEGAVARAFAVFRGFEPV